MDVKCRHCGARHFLSESTKAITETNPASFASCCEHGAVPFEALRPLPLLLRELMSGEHFLRPSFLMKVRQYNAALAFASINGSFEVPAGRGPRAYILHGQVYHLVSPVIPTAAHAPLYGQLYFLDAEEAIGHRLAHGPNVELDRGLISSLDRLIRDVNPFAAGYQMVRERQDGFEEHVQLHFVANPGGHPGRYNVPTSAHIAAFVPGREVTVTEHCLIADPYV